MPVNSLCTNAWTIEESSTQSRLGDRHPIGRQLAAELLQLLESGDANLEELIEIAAGDAEEPEPLEQRHRLIERLVEHPLIELEKRQLAIDVVLGCLEIRRIHRVLTRAAAPQAAERSSIPAAREGVPSARDQHLPRRVVERGEQRR